MANGLVNMGVGCVVLLQVILYLSKRYVILQDYGGQRIIPLQFNPQNMIS